MTGQSTPKPGRRASLSTAEVPPSELPTGSAPQPRPPACPKGVPPSKVLSCGKFRPAGPDRLQTCALCGRTAKSG